MSLGDLRADIKKITDRFFATGSPLSDFLDAYVRGEYKLPVTTTGIKGLPKVLRRGVVDSQDSGPSLLFLDLLNPPLHTDDPIPKRFRSNILLSKLEGMQAQDLPVFGVFVRTLPFQVNCACVVLASITFRQTNNPFSLSGTFPSFRAAGKLEQ